MKLLRSLLTPAVLLPALFTTLALWGYSWITQRDIANRRIGALIARSAQIDTANAILRDSIARAHAQVETVTVAKYLPARAATMAAVPPILAALDSGVAPDTGKVRTLATQCLQAVSSCDLLRFWNDEEKGLLRERVRRDSIEIADLRSAALHNAYSEKAFRLPMPQACYTKGAGIGAGLYAVVREIAIPAIRRSR